MSPAVYSALKSVSNAAFICSPALFILVAIVIVYIHKKGAKQILIVSLLFGVFCSLGLVEKAGQSMVGGLIIVAMPLYICFWALSPPFFISAYMLYNKERRNYRNSAALLITGLAILSINISYASIIPKKEASDRAFWNKVIRGNMVSLDPSEYQNHLSEEGSRSVEIYLRNGCKGVSRDVAGLLSELGFDTSQCDDLPDNLIQQHIEAGSIIKGVKYEDYIRIKSVKDRVALIQKIHHQKHYRSLPFDTSIDNEIIKFELENIESFLKEYSSYKGLDPHTIQQKLPYLQMFKPVLQLITAYSSDQQDLKRITNIVLTEEVDKNVDWISVKNLCGNPNIPGDTLERLVMFTTDGSFNSRPSLPAAVSNPNINKETLEYLLSSKIARYREEAISSPNLETRKILEILDSETDSKRDFVFNGLVNLAKRDELSEKQLIHYLDRLYSVKAIQGPQYRQSKYRYKEMPVELLKILATSEDHKNAREELSKRKPPRA